MEGGRRPLILAMVDMVEAESCGVWAISAENGNLLQLSAFEI